MYEVWEAITKHKSASFSISSWPPFFTSVLLNCHNFYLLRRALLNVLALLT